MRKMRDSEIEWIGKIPCDWEIKKCKYISSLYNGYAFDSKDLHLDFNYPVIRIGDIKDGGVDTVHCQGVNSNFGLGKYEVFENDILLAMSGATVGKIGIVHNVEKAYINQRVGIIRTSSPLFLYYCLSTNNFIDFVLLEANGSAQPNISGEVYGEFVVPYPSLLERTKIVEYLNRKCSEIDALVTNIQNQIETLEEYKRSVITEAVTKGLDPDVELKDSGVEWIGDIPQGWECKRLKYVANAIYKGNGITKEDVIPDGNIPCVRYGEIYTKYSYYFNNCITRTDLDRIKSKQYFSYGDILFAGTGELVEEIGKSIVYLGNEMCLAGGDIVVVSHSENPLFLGYLLSSEFAQGQKSAGKSKLKVVHISSTEIGNVRVLLPSFPEQKKIAAYLDHKCSEIDSIIKEKQQQLETLTEYKKSLIYEYVTGKKEVLQ